MKHVSYVAAACLVAVAGLAAQSTKPAISSQGSKPTSVSMVAAGPITTSIRSVYLEVKDYVLRSAHMVSEKELAFRPEGVTSEVRNFGQILGHIANESYTFCGPVMDGSDKTPNGADFEKITSKVDMEKALAAAFAYCDKAFNFVNDHNGGDPVKIFGQDTTRLGALAYNNAHDFEHYGNLVTYLRAMGKVPPSSQK
jgi:uncharacterized damage-inducible protein DinB